MVTFLNISKHTAADCPVNNAETKKVMIEGFSKMEELAKKHGVKIVGTWAVFSEHLVVQVFEAPSYEAFMAFGMEPPILKMTFWTTSEFKVAAGAQEMMQMVMQV